MAYAVSGCGEFEGGIAEDGDLPTADGRAGARYVDGAGDTSVRCSIMSGPGEGYSIDLEIDPISE